MPIIPVSSPADSRLTAYQRLKDRDVARQGGRFIAEGEFVVRRLISSGLAVDSVLLAERRSAFASIVPTDVPVFIASDDVITSTIGFAFHSGVIACGIRPA